jgi:threonine dehydrogenase-like Zn-dependent dehydrogenase
MRALHVPAPRQHHVADIPVPEFRNDEVLVEVQLCATCTQWDITTWTGIDIFEREGFPQYPLPPGATGHELAGVVVQAGKDVTSLKVGDRVAYWGNPAARRTPVNGGYAEFFAEHESSFVRYPESVSLRTAALTELLTCLSSALFKAGDVTGKRVGVSGLGPAGLMAVQALKAGGAREVIAFDIAPERIDLAVSLGADQGMVPESDEWNELLERDNWLDIGFDCIGLARSVNNLMRITREHLIIFGVPHGDIRYTMEAWFRDLRVDPAGPRTARGAQHAAHLLTTGKVKVDNFIGELLPLERYDEGVQLLIDKKAVKVAFDPKLTG